MGYLRITDFPADSETIVSPELEALAGMWLEKKSEIEKNVAFAEFVTRLKREWAVETGLVERLYTWDRGVTEVLIEQGIEAALITGRGGLRRDDAEHAKTLIDDQLGIIEGLFSFVKGEQPLTEHFIRGLHAQFTAHQDSVRAMTPDGKPIEIPTEKGTYKTHPNNPRRRDGEMHEYCPPEFVNDEMEQLLNRYREAEARVSPAVKAAWLHHRFTQIHPFQDGNGRVARALGSLVFLRAGLFPLVIRDSDRTHYIDALEEADRGDLRPLVTLFTRRQRECILSALGIEQQVQKGRYADQIISSVLQGLKERISQEQRRLNKVYDYGDLLVEACLARIEEISSALNEGFAGLPGEAVYRAKTGRAGSNSDKRHYFHGQIVEIARTFNYFANLDRYRAWVRLSIDTEVTFEYVVSFHGYGPEENGIVAVSAFTAQRLPREEGGTDVVNTVPACTDFFQFNYRETEESTRERFDAWIEESLAMALTEWKRRVSP